MALTPAQMDRKIDEHFDFEARDDIVGYPTGPTVGRDAARIFYEGLFNDLSESTVETKRRLYGDSFLVDDSLCAENVWIDFAAIVAQLPQD